MAVFASLQRLQDFTVLGPCYQISRTPNFKNLETLRLIYLQGPLSKNDARCVGDMIVSSPQLHNLALSLSSLSYAYSNSEPPLGEIIRSYSVERRRRQLPILGLSHLDLGLGFLPSGNPPLSMLTDLTKLRHLRLRDNYDNLPGMEAWDLNIREFFGATQLRRLAVTKYTKQMDELLDLPDLSESLEDIEVTTPWYCRPAAHTLWCYLHNRRFSWRRVCLTVQIRDIDDLGGPHPKETKITDLRVPADDNCLKRIKTFIIHVLPNLEVLHFTGGRIQKRRRPGQTRKYKRIDWTFDQIFATHAKDIFRRNRVSVLKDRNHSPLREVWFHRHIFRCSLLQYGKEKKSSYTTFAVHYTNEAGEEDTVWYEIAKLSMSEALAREEVLEMVYFGEKYR